MNKPQLTDLFREFNRSQNLFAANDKILLAVSGGLDSVVMTHLFRTSGIEFGIAHCNFKLRDRDSDDDALFVKSIALQFDVSFYSTEFDTISYQKANKLSLEEAARNLRYAWLEEIRSHFGYNLIATAHHLNDSIETLIMNLTRGTGINGLCGIPPRLGKIIRPMLFASRNEIELFSKERKIQYRDDATNRENNFTRNKIRNTVIPLLKEINPSLEATFKKNMAHFRDAAIIYNSFLEKKINKISIRRAENIYLPISAFQHLEYATSLLHYFLSSSGFNEDQVAQIIASVGNSGRQFLSESHRVIIDRDYLILTSDEIGTSPVIIIEEKDRSVPFGEHKLNLEFSNYKPGMKFNNTGNIAYFDADKIEFPLQLRKWQKGDYLYPLGMTKKNSDKPGKKKVSDLLTDSKIDLLQKEKTFVLLSGDKIIWIAGLRQDGRFATTSSTKRLLKIKMLPRGEHL